MRQVVFSKKNEPRWKKMEVFIRGRITLDADELAENYIDITDDLAYAKTFYPDSKLIDYLNTLAYNLHNKIYKNKKEDSGRFFLFVKEEVPLALYRQRKKLYYAGIIFIVAVVIGLFSAYKDASFVRLILGDQYVNMTLENIKQGDPMAVYKSGSETSMFFGIGINNIRVSFMAFAAGIFASLLTGYILFANGVMVGAFIYFFIKEGLFQVSFTTIFIHGTLELSAIVIAGAAGMVIGNSWLFPGTYSRTKSLVMASKDAIKIIMGLVPVFVFAALLESYVTRHYMALGLSGRLFIILLSAVFVLWYFIYYPRKVNQKIELQEK